jgi:hypothetical protein
MRPDFHGVIDKSVKAVEFIKTRTPDMPFTIADMASFMGLKKANNAYKYMEALSLYYPIYEVSPYRKGSGFARGAVPATFAVLKNNNLCFQGNADRKSILHLGTEDFR